ncbi:MAG: tRNA uridine-5-carboxymethylaminomethyl(34) synthesis GTPase MnmE [Desulfobacterales bacterium]
MNQDTIAAIATPLGTGGISIVKISGPEALSTVSPFFRPRNPQRYLDEIPSQVMVYGHFIDLHRGDLIDEVLLTVLRGPRSFTGEDLVEINCHGGPQVTAVILDILLQSGLRLAEPGEFTRRAFLNGRIDLTQVEATIDLIHARTRRAARLSSQMMARGLGEEILRLKNRVAEARTLIEADIDFGDDIGTEMAPDFIKNTIIAEVIPAINDLIAHYHDGRMLREGLRVVLAGTPNVGKSSLMNQLLDQERAIVTDVPGTTRDTIEEGLAIEGVPISLCDTAGLQPSTDPIDRMGQRKTREAIQKADLILFMVDASRPIDDSDRQLLAYLGNRPYLVLRNKCDLVADRQARTTLDETPPEGYLDISALYGEGLENLKKRLLAAARVDQGAEAKACLPNLRQKALLLQALTKLSAVVDADRQSMGLEIMAIDMREAERHLNQILGVDVEMDVLDGIFNRFCIGK